ncbi:MAG: hypothetical protein NT167_01455 [Verrucomicrobia bacterium]|nr:hypothetical protein [Verrucomicrobiota bacterium]
MVSPIRQQPHPMRGSSVLFCTNLTSGLWDKLADVPAQPSNSTAQVTDPAVTNSPQRF